MNNIIRTFAITAALACASGTAAQAQSTARDSSTSGVHLGLYLHQAVVHVDYDELSGWDHGLGVGLHAGYEYTPNASVFVRVDAAKVSDGFVLTHGDLGLRLSLGRSGAVLRPFAQAAVGARYVSSDEADVAIRGFAFTAGGGVEYFVSRTVAIESGLSLSAGMFTEGRLGDSGWVDLEGDLVKAVSSRLDIGVSWHP